MPLSFADRTRKTVLSKRLRRFFDLNTDLGQAQDAEFFANPDTSLLRLVSTVNIPCCVHDGEPDAVMRAIELAKSYNCSVAAHIGYPDPVNQGYQSMASMSPQALSAWILLQVGAMQAMLKTFALTLEVVRPHGALYWDMATQPQVAQTVAQTIARLDRWMFLVGPACPQLQQLSEKEGLRIAPEAVLGKRYRPDGLPMLMKDPALPDMDADLPPAATLEQAKQLLRNSQVTSYDGQSISATAQTLHISPRMKSAVGVAERVVAMLGQPIPLSAAAVGISGWLDNTEPSVETRPWLCGVDTYL